MIEHIKSLGVTSVQLLPVHTFIPMHPGGRRWSLLIDTNSGHEADGAHFPLGAVYDVTARSLLLFAPEATP